ncbi:MAG TPA: bifunctional sulfate adenylyltransferase/adenylylsulfate kinase [Candidatus Paceibacterota bacterium]
MQIGNDNAVYVGNEKEVIEELLLSARRVKLADRQLCDVELLLVGGFHPLTGFLGKEDYESVISSSRLKSGQLWPVPIVLDTPLSDIKIGEKIILTDTYGTPVAILDVSSVYKPDKRKEALAVYGTDDRTHPGVEYLFEKTADTYVGGQVGAVSASPPRDFQTLRHTPQELREIFRKKGWNKVVAFQTRNPIHRAHYELIVRSAKEHNAAILVHPAVGLTKDGDIDYRTRVKSYEKLLPRLPDNSIISLLPIAMRMAGPREALWHALIRKNYGATHFIIGRDHAGPGKDKGGKPFYGPYEAQEFVDAYSSELGITIVKAKELVYLEDTDTYVAADVVPKGAAVKNISGTEFRKLLRGGVDIPSWFSFPEVIEELRKGERKDLGGFAIFLTGLSGAGKSTIAAALETTLADIQQKNITMLDGDVVREHLSKGLGFSREDRNANVRRIGFVAGEVVKHGGIAICSAIAPYRESRDANRKLIERYGKYVEIFVSTPLEVCKDRDVKGLYRKAIKENARGFTGLSDPYEVPENPELSVDTSVNSLEQAVEIIINFLRQNNFLTS